MRGWGLKPVGDPGEQPDFGVGRFDQSLGQTVFEVGVDRFMVSGDLFGEVDKRGETNLLSSHASRSGVPDRRQNTPQGTQHCGHRYAEPTRPSQPEA
jgi:hypothetical protein